MVIYLDLVIIINFIIDFIILIGVSLLLKRNTNIKRIFIAAFVGGTSTLLLFYVHHNLILLIYKLIISILMVIIAFKYEDFNYFKDNLLWLYMISIILGGSIYLLNDQLSLTNQGIVFKGNGLYINLFVLLLISPLIIYKYIKYQKHFKLEYSNYYDVDIYYKGIKLSETGFLDTGNKLKDPYFGRPIILVNKELIKLPIKSFYVPYKALGKDGLLEVFKPEKIMINKKNKPKLLVGLSDININGVKIILNTEAIWKSYIYGYANY